MKHFYTLIFILWTTFSFGQIQKLSELSGGELIGSTIVYEENDSHDVYGYFLLYQFNQQSRDIYDFEYVLLDKNLNKITSNTFTEGVYKRFLGRTTVHLGFVKKYKDQLLFEIFDRIYVYNQVSGANTKVGNQRYHHLDLKTLELTPDYVIKQGEPIKRSYKSGERFKKKDFEDLGTLTATNGGGMVYIPDSIKSAYQGGIMDPREFTKGMNKRFFGVIKDFQFLDPNFNLSWKAKINQDEDNLGIYEYAASDQSILVLKKENIEKTAPFSELELFDIKTGKKINSFVNEDPNYKMNEFSIHFNKNQIIIYNMIFSPKEKNIYKYSNGYGYAKIILDKKTGKEVSRKFLKWSDFSKHLDIGENGKIKKYGKIFIENFVPFKDGETLAIAEGYNKGGKTSVKDLYLLKLDADFDINYFEKKEKTETIYKGKMGGASLLSKGNFAYFYGQELDDDGNYVFLCVDNETEGSLKKQEKNPQWSLDFITYVDGEFDSSKLKLTREDSQIVPMKAKKGWVILQKFSEKEGVDMQLERINY